MPQYIVVLSGEVDEDGEGFKRLGPFESVANMGGDLLCWWERNLKSALDLTGPGQPKFPEPDVLLQSAAWAYFYAPENVPAPDPIREQYLP